MATPQRQASIDLIAEVLERYRDSDDFFQLVRMLERMTRRRPDAEGTVAAGVGRDGPPAAEPVRFHAVNSFAFADRAVEGVWRDPTASGERLEMNVTFMGLNGPTGVLPQQYSKLVQSRLKQRDTALADFLDIFNHRLIALYYRAWAKYRLTVQHEDHLDDPLADPVARALRALAGQQAHHRFDPRLYFAGHFSRHTRSASALQRLLSDYLGCPVEVLSFVGQWLPIPPEDRLRIGTGSRGRNNLLGQGVLPGARAWDLQSKFKVRIGPIDDAQHDHLLPGGEGFRQLRRLIEEYSPGHMDVELEFVVKGSQERKLGAGLKLGLNFWLRSRRHLHRIARIQLRRNRN